MKQRGNEDNHSRRRYLQILAAGSASLSACAGIPEQTETPTRTGATSQTKAVTQTETDTQTERSIVTPIRGKTATQTTVSPNKNRLQEAINAAEPGEEVVIKDGVHQFSERLSITHSGTPEDPITIRPAEGAAPVFEWTGVVGGDRDSGLKFSNCSHWVLDGIEVRGSTWKGVNCNSDCSDLVWQNLRVHDNDSWGIMVNGADGITIRNCDSYNNYDARNQGENSDGINFTGPATNGLIERCRAWKNGDDGFDFWVSENHTVQDCWAWNNGRGTEGDGNGFKLGGGPDDGGGHRVERCVAYDHPHRGFDWNTTDNPVTVVNCTAVNNKVNYRFREVEHVLENNISYQGMNDIRDDVRDSHNTWNLDVTDPRFKSLDPSSSDFMRLEEKSPCVDAGTSIDGISVEDGQPDLGAYEQNESRPNPGVPTPG